jgi:hypothetical protein
MLLCSVTRLVAHMCIRPSSFNFRFRYNKKRYEEIQATQQITRRSKAHRHMKRQKKNKK